ncbi:MAG: type II toxin-antitoxin system RelE/ParE family toxin [Opitutales bacterium]|jgi:toxin HigB-1|nr:type II toxin-antitoxin system RelE/ParE family toxin [Opitutales bacterium]
MIQSFADKETQKLWNTEKSRKYNSISRPALRKLIQLHAAVVLEDLRFPPGNHLEQLIGDRKGQHSIRINQQFRICFKWTEAGPGEVEIVDYH